MGQLPEHAMINRTYWDDMADDWVASGERKWAEAEPTWGIWGVPEAAYPLLPDDMTGLDTIELGCGTGYVSGWMARRGAGRLVGVDNSARQLETARRLAAQHGVELELIHGNAEEVPLPSASFDFVISEYGAVLWCDPALWLPEAYRLLRPGGRLVCWGNAPLGLVCAPFEGGPTGERLIRDYFALGRIDWSEVEGEGGVEFHLPISGWFRLFREVGFQVEDYHEVQAPEGIDEVRYCMPAAWARRFPAEHVWKLIKPAP